MRRVFKVRYFSRWMRKTSLAHASLCKAVIEMERGLIDAELGGGLIKQRVRLPGRGKRGSARVLAATNRKDRWFFLYGFEKNDRDNVSDDELEGLQEIARVLLARTPQQLDAAVTDGSLQEICHEQTH